MIKFFLDSKSVGLGQDHESGSAPVSGSRGRNSPRQVSIVETPPVRVKGQDRPLPHPIGTVGRGSQGAAKCRLTDANSSVISGG